MQAAQAAYRRFVAEGKNQPSPWQVLKNQIYLGSEAFVNEMQRKVQADRRLSEVPKTSPFKVTQSRGFLPASNLAGYSADSDHSFRRKPSTCSGGFRPPVPG